MGVEPFSIGAVMVAAARLGAKACLRFAPAIAGAIAAVIAAVAAGGRGWMALVLVAEIPIAALVSQSVLAEMRGKRASLAATVRTVPKVAGVMIAVWLVAAALFVALMLPVMAGGVGPAPGLALVLGAGAIEVVLYSRWFVVVPVAVFEKVGVREALARSGVITAPQRRALIAIVALVFVGFVGAELVVDQALGVDRSRWFVDAAAPPAVRYTGIALWLLLAAFRAALSAAAYHLLRQDYEGGSPEELEAIFE
jgi:hypothetical protein